LATFPRTLRTAMHGQGADYWAKSGEIMNAQAATVQQTVQ
jgi:hypothetical protein